MPHDHARLFLLSDAPALDEFIREFAEFLKTQPTPSLEAILLADTTGTSDGNTPRKWREGDILLTLFAESDPDATEAAVECCRRGAAQGMVLVPVLLRSGPPREDSLEALHRDFPLHFLAPERAREDLLPMLYGMLRTQCALGSTQADLFLQWPRENRPGEAAVELLQSRNDGSAGVSQLAASANESRHQAARTIEARLFASAIEALSRAASFDVTSALTSHWRARLLMAQGRREDLQEALREATRSARLAAMGSARSPLEAAGWHLAAHVAIRLQDHGAAREYLEEFQRAGTPGTARALSAAALYLHLGENETARAAVEAACQRDSAGLDEALADPALAPLWPALAELREQRCKVLREALDRLFKAEDFLLQHTPVADIDRRRDERTQAAQRCRNVADLETLEAELKATARRQIAHLEAWAGDLCARHVERSNLRRAEHALSAATLEPPAVTPWEGVLEFFWRPLRRLREALATARDETRIRRSEIQQRLERAHTQFHASLESFLQGVGQTEEAISLAPVLFSAGPADAKPQPRELAFLTADDFARLGLKQDPELLPDALAAEFDGTLPVPPARLPGIYRIEVTAVGDLGASRCGVYFHRMGAAR